jgi:PAS domain S-box-containing protein
LAVNLAFEELTGYKEIEVADNSQLMWEIIVPEYRDDVARRISDGDESPYRCEYITKGGDRVAVYVRPKLVHYNGKGLCRAAVITVWEDRLND